MGTSPLDAGKGISWEVSRMGALYNCLCPRCGNISMAYLEDEGQVAGLVCAECGAGGLKALPKSVFGT